MKSVRVFFATCALAVLFSEPHSTSAQLQINTREAEASGTAVVLLTLAEIEQSGIFPSDNGILRRIAYVETRDGVDEGTYREGFDGGIWAVKETIFRDTQNTAVPKLVTKHVEIFERFYIEWFNLPWSELRKPLFSAIASHLVLYIAPAAVPQANEIQAQAMFWVNYYNSEGTISDFTATSTGLRGNFVHVCVCDDSEQQ